MGVRHIVGGAPGRRRVARGAGVNGGERKGGWDRGARTRGCAVRGKQAAREGLQGPRASHRSPQVVGAKRHPRAPTLHTRVEQARVQQRDEVRVEQRGAQRAHVGRARLTELLACGRRGPAAAGSGVAQV